MTLSATKLALQVSYKVKIWKLEDVQLLKFCEFTPFGLWSVGKTKLKKSLEEFLEPSKSLCLSTR